MGGRGTHELLHALAAVCGKGKIPAEKAMAYAKEGGKWFMHGGMPRREKGMGAEGAKPDD
jgi:hypothetical protein